jgi:16S rRNA U516 pseudouridylate synthase RsuA-like enzyme
LHKSVCYLALEYHQRQGTNKIGHSCHNEKINEEITYIEDQPKSEIGLKMKTSNVKIVRRIFEHLKYDVLKVDRVTFAGLTKKNLPRGDWRFLTEQEIINLKNA